MLGSIYIGAISLYSNNICTERYSINLSDDNKTSDVSMAVIAGLH